MAYRNGEVIRILSAVDQRVYFDAPITLTELSGIGMPPILKRTVSSPFQHGNTYLGMVWEPRPLTLSISIAGCSRVGLWNAKQVLYDILCPLSGELWFQVWLPDGTRYTLEKVYFESGLESGIFPRQDALHAPDTFILMAHDPIWYAEREQFTVKEVGSGVYTTEELSFEAEFPIEFGLYHYFDPLTTYDLTIPGNWYSWPEMTIIGPVRNPGYINNTTGERLQLAYFVENAEIVTVVTKPGHVLITNNTGDDLTPYVTEASDISSSYLLPAVYNGGDPNEIAFTGSDTDAGSAIIFYYKPAFIGI